MKFSSLFCFLVLITAGAPRTGAQTETAPMPRPTPPAPPFVNATPDFSAWSIVRYTIPGLGSQSAEAVVRSAAAASKPESQASVIKTGPIRHQVKRLKTGEQEDIWYEHGNRITVESFWKLPLFEGEASAAKQPQGPDFPELSWIAAGNFVGTQAYEGAAYFVFETQVTEGNARLAKDYGYKLSSTFNRAYINADTRFPWLLQTGDILQRYGLQAAPAAMLDVPREYQTMFDAYERRKIEMLRKPVAP